MIEIKNVLFMMILIFIIYIFINQRSVEHLTMEEEEEEKKPPSTQTLISNLMVENNLLNKKVATLANQVTELTTKLNQQGITIVTNEESIGNINKTMLEIEEEATSHLKLPKK